MPINPSAIGAVTEPAIYEWTDRDTLLYALGVGAGVDDLAFTTENSHDIPQQVLPTSGAAPKPMQQITAKVGSTCCCLLYTSPSPRDRG